MLTNCGKELCVKSMLTECGEDL